MENTIHARTTGFPSQSPTKDSLHREQSGSIASSKTVAGHQTLDDGTEKAGKEQRNPSADGARMPCKEKMVVLKPTAPEHPHNWPKKKKLLVVLAGILAVINSTIGSSLPSGAISFIAEYWSVKSKEQLVLPISVFLIGYVLGPTVFGPLSESYGRRPVMLYTFIVYTAFTLACALAPSWPLFLVFRLMAGITASAPIAVVGGLYADIYGDPRQRGRAIAYFMAATTCGPVLGPSVSGFLSIMSWRWTFWCGLMLAGVTIPFLVFLPETYLPVLEHRKAKRLRKETGNQDLVAPSEIEKKDVRHIVTVVLTRPFRMIIFESIVLFSCLYLSLAYAIFYLYFQAYPIIFQGPQSIYKMTPGVAGLAFLPIGVGAILCAFIFAWYDNYLAQAQKRHAPWAAKEEYRRLPLACVGGPLYVISLFWLAWSAYATVHWIVPMLSGLFFGIGFLLIFIAILNYLTDAYHVFAASANGIASTCRSIFGALLPFASRPMYMKLGVHWAGTLLAFVSLGMTIIPFAFIRYGDRIRANSRFCQALKAADEKAAAEAAEERRQYELMLPGEGERNDGASEVNMSNLGGKG